MHKHNQEISLIKLKNQRRLLHHAFEKIIDNVFNLSKRNNTKTLIENEMN